MIEPVKRRRRASRAKRGPTRDIRIRLAEAEAKVLKLKAHAKLMAELAKLDQPKS